MAVEEEKEEGKEEDKSKVFPEVFMFTTKTEKEQGWHTIAQGREMVGGLWCHCDHTVLQW